MRRGIVAGVGILVVVAAAAATTIAIAVLPAEPSGAVSGVAPIVATVQSATPTPTSTPVPSTGKPAVVAPAPPHDLGDDHGGSGESGGSGKGRSGHGG